MSCLHESSLYEIEEREQEKKKQGHVEFLIVMLCRLFSFYFIVSLSIEFYRDELRLRWKSVDAGVDRV